MIYLVQQKGNTIYILAKVSNIFAFVGMAPKGSTLSVFFAFVIAAGVSFLIASPIVRLSNSKGSLEDARQEVASRKSAAKGLHPAGVKVFGEEE